MPQQLPKTMSIDVPMGNLLQQITVDVKLTGYECGMARLWIAKQLLLLAARISGMGIEVEDL